MKKIVFMALAALLMTALNCGVSDGLKQINVLLKQVSSALNTALEGAKGFFEELGD